ncbi:Potassium channel toxin alpha-KTx 15.8 [Bienertia sinuspersici]
MSYRSKRTISNLATDASKRLKKPMPPLVSQSSTPANTATPPPPPPPPLNEANDTSESKQLIKQLPPKATDHVQQERIRLTAQLQHQKNSVMQHQRHENSRDTINMQQEGGGKASYMQQEMQESSRRTINMQQQAQQRVGKCWRHYKHELKKTFFQPDKKTHEQHYDLVPSGHSRSDWIKLVDHWFSPKGQKLSQIGKEARSLQFQAHTMGSNSYANLRADYSDAKAKVDSLKLNNSSSSSVDVEDEAFHSLMNGGDIPERPQGFGFGVKKVTFMGFVTNEVLKKENRELSMKNDENTRTLKTVLTQFSQILDAVRKGKASVELIDAAQSALHMAIPEIRSRGGGGASVCRLEAAAAAECDGGACLCRPEAAVDC